MNVITQVEFELTYFKAAVQHLRDKEVHAFPKSISPKVNVITQVEFELTYFKAAVQHLRDKEVHAFPWMHRLGGVSVYSLNVSY